MSRSEPRCTVLISRDSRSDTNVEEDEDAQAGMQVAAVGVGLGEVRTGI